MLSKIRELFKNGKNSFPGPRFIKRIIDNPNANKVKDLKSTKYPGPRHIKYNNYGKV